MNSIKYLSVFLIILLSLNCHSPSEPVLNNPTIKILSPENGNVLSIVNRIIFTVNTENEFYGKVEFFFDNEKISTMSSVFDTSYYEDYFEWSDETVLNQPGEHSIELKLFSESGTLLNTDKIKGKSIPVLYPPIFNKGTFKINWTEYSGKNFDRYILFESESQNMSNLTEIYSSRSFKDTNFLVPDIAPNIRKYYQLFTITTEGDSIFSSIVTGSSYKKIVFTAVSEKSNSGKREIFLIDCDGNNKIQLTDNWQGYYSPHFSPDGLKIVYNSVNEIYMMDINGNHQFQLSNNGEFPRFTPDGSMIVFTERSDIYKMAIDGSNQTRLTDTPFIENSPRVSPNGRDIIFPFYDQDRWDIGYVGIDGSHFKNLTQSNEECYSPRFSPDGKKIIYNLWTHDRSDIIMMNIDGSDPHNITQNFDEGVRDADYSPDGSKIIIISTYGIYTINPDGTNITHLVDDTKIVSAQFTPDGKRILFNSNYNLFLVNIDGSNLIQLTNINDNQQEEFQPGT